jgi:hypothetical protein
MMKCLLCEDTGWVCENHPDQPWQGRQACDCGGAGAPCPRCNAAAANEPPRLPKGFKPDRPEGLSRPKTAILGITGGNSKQATEPTRQPENVLPAEP